MDRYDWQAALLLYKERDASTSETAQQVATPVLLLSLSAPCAMDDSLKVKANARARAPPPIFSFRFPGARPFWPLCHSPAASSGRRAARAALSRVPEGRQASGERVAGRERQQVVVVRRARRPCEPRLASWQSIEWQARKQVSRARNTTATAVAVAAAVAAHLDAREAMAAAPSPAQPSPDEAETTSSPFSPAFESLNSFSFL